eukprot:TRINITY_DN18074_c0_g1_i1.p1 TRINITY_DN18074_c0_g1~~TRINITY_DN18074_c0_g1_i1.p1  ORF type:complete len:436 (-),score=29.32 TRINITY_DN18074_c0_g1_i1:213-1520(-)
MSSRTLISGRAANGPSLNDYRSSCSSDEESPSTSKTAASTRTLPAASVASSSRSSSSRSSNSDEESPPTSKAAASTRTSAVVSGPSVHNGSTSSSRDKESPPASRTAAATRTVVGDSTGSSLSVKLVRTTFLLPSAAYTWVHKVCLVLAFVGALILYCLGLRLRSLEDAIADLNPIGYTQHMFLCGLIWASLEIWNVLVLRDLEVRYWQALGTKLSELPEDKETSGSSAGHAAACIALAERLSGSYLETLGILVGLTVWMPDPVRKKTLEAEWENGIIGDINPIYTSLVFLGFYLFLSGVRLHYLASSYKAEWIRRHSDASGVDSLNLHLRIAPWMDGYFGTARGNDMKRKYGACWTRHPEFTARWMLFCGWSFISMSGISLLYAMAVYLEFRYCTLPALENLYMGVWGEGVWKRFCVEKAPNRLLPRSCCVFCC